jgi:type IV secretion system protein VirB10
MSDRAPIEGERDPSQVAATKRPWLTRSHITTIGIVGIMLMGTIIYLRMPSFVKKTEDDTKKGPPMVGAIQPWTPPPAPPATTPIQRVVMQPPPPAPAVLQPTQVQTAVTAQAKEEARPVMLAFQVPSVPESLKPKAPVAATGTSQAAEEHTAVAYKADAVAGLKAGPFGDSALKLKPGLLRCTMNTSINSDIPGPFICTLPADARSDQGVVVMARGTRVVGTYDSKNANGQSRLAASGLTAYTPNDCVVPLGGNPMADTLGSAGIEGERDTHFWQKFGFALILTAIDVGTQLGQSALSNGQGNTYLSFGSGGGVSQFAQDVLRDKMQIHDTVRVNQGSDVAIFLAQPTDFSDCISELQRR